MADETGVRRGDCAEGDEAPHALTIFLRAGERREVVRALRALHADRATAVRMALGLVGGERRARGAEGGVR